jgi:protein phosphatase
MFGTHKRGKLRATNPGIASCTVDARIQSDAGPHRQSNEDSGRVLWQTEPEQALKKGVLVIVADGMGGHEGGEVASAMAVRIAGDVYSSAKSDPQRSLVDAFQAANREIFAYARDHSQLAGMGTTCTAIAVVDGVAYSAHIGDSRAYLVRGDQIYRMTEDHSATMAMVKQGLLTMSEAREHEDRNVILRAMGTHPQVEVATWDAPFALWPGDRLVLCSDGLHDIVTDTEIAAIAGSTEPQEACSRMLKLALDRSCTDNVTVAVLRVYGPEERNGSGPRATREAVL